MLTPDGYTNTHPEITLSHLSYFKFLKYKRSLGDFLKHGISSSTLFSNLQSPKYLQHLYQSKNPDYMKYLGEFKERFSDYDVLVMNPGVELVHPEFLYKNFKNSLKCLHFIDDPHMTYAYGLPFAWAFNCATYVSPSYSQEFRMSEILNLAGLKNTKWVPHCITNFSRSNNFDGVLIMFLLLN
jgi:hypothetical protein